MSLNRLFQGFTLLLVLSLPYLSFGKMSGINLGCKHIPPIEQSYLSRHINYRQTSPNLESRVIDQFIKKLDGSKMYFLQGDVEQIKKEMKNLFGRVRSRDCNQIKNAYGRLVSRVKERVKFVTNYLGPKFKFNKNTELTLDPSHKKYPKTKKEAHAFHKKYIQFQISNYLATDMKLDEAKQNVIRSYERIVKKVAKVQKSKNESDLWAIYLDAFSSALDPHSGHLSQDELEDFKIQMSLALEGIGATLSSRDGFTIVEQLVPGGAAARSSKIQPKDKIIAVGQGEKGQMEIIVEQELRDVVRKIRGPKGTKVRLKILRKSGKKVDPFVVTLVRDKIKLEDEAASIHYIEKKKNGQKKIVGLVNLPSFYADSRRKGRSSAKDLKKILKEAREKKVDGIILDLSSNGGGALDDAVQIAGLFFRKGNVVKQSHRDPNQGDLVLVDKDPAVDYSGPLVVLTSRISASASEIVAGTLQDYQRALIIGADHTFGKGSVQSVEPLPPGLGAIKTTVGMFFTAGGASTQHRGVAANIPLPSVYATDDEIGEKTLDYSLPPKKMAKFLSKEAYVSKGEGAWKLINKPLIKRLADKSKKRVEKSKDFDKVRKDIAKMKKRGKTIKVSDILDEGEPEGSDKKESVGSLNANKHIPLKKFDIKSDKEESVESSNAKADKKGEKEPKNGILSAEEKKEKYLKRADIQEAIHIMMDYIEEYSKEPMTVGAKTQKSW